MKPSILFFSAVACVVAPWLHAGPQAVQGIDKTAAEVRVRYADGVLVLRPLADDAVRVRFGDARLPEKPSFVLTQPIPTPAFKVEDGPRLIKVSTGKLQVAVDRESGALAFLDASGRVLLREPIAGARKLTPKQIGPDKTFTVEQVFQSPPDEFLYGLGQYQDGIWNWRGIPLELRQLNTQIAVPMLISSKGYGLLWDNASLTDFNPADQRIPLKGGNAADTGGKKPNATEDLDTTPMDLSKIGHKTGTFTTGEAGEYAFLAKDGDRSGDFAILIDGKQVAGVTNMWTPRGLSAKVSLPARTTVAVGVRGGGRDVKLFARPLGDTTTFRAEMGDAIDYTFFYGPSVDAIVAGYRKATGEAPMWPKWAYGFWQCRERYSSQKQILDTVAEFRKRGIPMDLIVQDWHYWGRYGWGAYQWDEKDYPDPAALLKGVHDQNARFMISVWCNPKGKAGDELKQNNLFVGGWLDVFSQQGRDIRWKHINEGFFRHGTDGWWGDGTEPGDDGNSLAGRQTGAGPGSFMRNSYPLFASRSLYEGQLSSNPDKRVCILTRSAYPGMQRYAAAAWSGDINGDWITLKRQIPAGLNFSITGIPYWTTDTGGFFHPNDQYTNADYNELLARWFQWSTFCPILRIHGFKTETEMWKWLPETQKVLMAYNELRYRMLPYNYSVAWKVTSEGYTILRPLAMDFPQDQRALALSDSYMFGPAFLVAPVTDPVATTAGTRKVYLPAGTDWINFWTGEKVTGGHEITTPAPLETLPLFVRAGSIVPMGPVMQYATEKPDAPYEIRVYPGADGRFTIYEDDNETYAYKKGAHATIPLTWDDRRRELVIGARVGEFPGLVRERLYRVVFVKPGRGVGALNSERVDVEVRYTGAAITIPSPRQ
ncbi:MAG TPA: glycoside hydrolase family 31 protein [Rariglobus sp.]